MALKERPENDPIAYPGKGGHTKISMTPPYRTSLF